MNSRLLATAAGLVLLVVPAVAWWSGSRTHDTVGDSAVLPAPSPTGAAELPVATATPSPSAPPPPVAAAPSIGRRDGRLTSATVERPAPPLRLVVPDLGVDAAVVPVGVTDDDEMEIPADVTTVGWYRFGPSPGTPGAAVLAGHVDDRVQGRGVFFDLSSIEPGATVTVAIDDGSTVDYRVTARRQYDKPLLPTDTLFSRDGPSRLVLITCGGEFDAAAGSYRSNVVVVAELVG